MCGAVVQIEVGSSAPVTISEAIDNATLQRKWIIWQCCSEWNIRFAPCGVVSNHQKPENETSGSFFDPRSNEIRDCESCADFLKATHKHTHIHKMLNVFNIWEIIWSISDNIY